jgi:outer membrane protein TolC
MRKSISLSIILLFISVIGIAQKQNITIGILHDVNPQNSKPLFEQLKKEITDLVGADHNIQFKDALINNYNLSTAVKNYETLIESETDIILAFGVVNSIMLYQQKSYPKPTIVVGAINKDFVELPEGQKTSLINNITYLITPFSYTEDLNAFEDIYSYKKMGVLVDSFLLNYLPIKQYFDQYYADKEATYQFIFSTDQDQLNADLKNIDAIYLINGNTTSGVEGDQLIEIINQNKVPSISAYGIDDVKQGILMSNQPEVNINQIFRRIALDIESIIDGTNASELPLFIAYNKVTSINVETAKQIDFPIRYSLIGSANLIEGNNIKIDTSTSYSLKELLDEAIQQNLGLESERKNIQLAEQDTRTSKSQYLPDVTANASGVYIDPKLATIANGQNPEFSTGGNVALKQVLYSEQATANITIQKYFLDAQKETYNGNELDVLLQTSSSYYNALIVKTNVKIQNQNLQLTKRNLDIATQNYTVGVSGKSDVLRFKSQLAQNTQTLIQSRNSLDQAYFSINQIINQPIDNDLEIANSDISEDIIKSANYKYLIKALDDPRLKHVIVGFLVKEAKSNSPELKNLDYNIDATVRNYKLNNTGRYIPTLALQGQYDYNFSKSGAGSDVPTGFPTSPQGNYNVAVNLSLPIFQQNQQNLKRQTAKIQEDQLYVQKENTGLNIEKNINDIVLDLINEMTNIEISNINEEFSRESLELSQNEYRNGAIPVIQLIDAQNNYLKAQLSKATANFNYLLVTMKLERAIGYFFSMHSTADNLEFIQRANQYILNNQ